MDNRPVGIFDSGLGGLSCVREVLRLLPAEDIVFFGDTARVPYGGRSTETLRRYAAQDMAFLLSQSVKAIVIACGTVSSTVDPALLDRMPCPVVEVVTPSARAAARVSKSGRIGVIGTAATVASGKLADTVRRERPDAQVFARACPLFVPVVEAGHVAPDDPILALLCEEYLSGLREDDIDTLILGCTHYPLIAETIGRCMGEGVTLVNSGLEAARTAAAVLKDHDLLCARAGEGRRRYCVTDSPQGFSATARLFLGRDISGEMQRVPLSVIENPGATPEKETL